MYLVSIVFLREHSIIMLAYLGGRGESRRYEQSADTANDLEGCGVLSKNPDMLTLRKEGEGELKDRAFISEKFFKLSIN